MTADPTRIASTATGGDVSTSPPVALDRDARRHWALDHELAFLNHGSFGAVPRAVAGVQDAWRRRIERNPVEALDRRLGEWLGRARTRVGAFLGASPDAVGFVTNATEGANAYLRHGDWRAGDRIVAPDHVYNAIRQAARQEARARGLLYEEFTLPFPITGPDEVLDAFDAAIDDRTKLVIVDHVTSPTALVMPVERIIALAHERGARVLLDAAHAPGMLPFSIEALGADAWTGNLHKWPCAPRGAAVFWVSEAERDRIHPAIVSHFLDQGFRAEFAWQGTRDATAWLTAPEAIDWMERTFGWSRVRSHNHRLVSWAHAMLCDRLGARPCSPLDGSMLGSIATIALPERLRDRFGEARAIQSVLHDEHRIELPVHDWNDGLWLRISAQVYNSPEEYERLADALETMMS